MSDFTLFYIYSDINENFSFSSLANNHCHDLCDDALCFRPVINHLPIDHLNGFLCNIQFTIT